MGFDIISVCIMNHAHSAEKTCLARTDSASHSESPGEGHARIGLNVGEQQRNILPLDAEGCEAELLHVHGWSFEASLDLQYQHQQLYVLLHNLCPSAVSETP